MKRTKTQKGITLVALIITIVVLLILAVVAISSITNDGILGHATNASDAYNQAQANEGTILNSYMDHLNLEHVNHEFEGDSCIICGWTCNHKWDDGKSAKVYKAYAENHQINCQICEYSELEEHNIEYYCDKCGYLGSSEPWEDEDYPS